VALGASHQPGRTLPGVAPGPELPPAGRAGKLACHQGGLDISFVVTYDEQSGASGHHQRVPFASRPRDWARGPFPSRASSPCRSHHRQRNHAPSPARHHVYCRFRGRPSSSECRSTKGCLRAWPGKSSLNCAATTRGPKSRGLVPTTPAPLVGRHCRPSASTSSLSNALPMSTELVGPRAGPGCLAKPELYPLGYIGPCQRALGPYHGPPRQQTM
jgi:hypothetical protein